MMACMVRRNRIYGLPDPEPQPATRYLEPAPAALNVPVGSWAFLFDDRRILQKLADLINAVDALRVVEQSRLVVEKSENNEDEPLIIGIGRIAKILQPVIPGTQFTSPGFSMASITWF